MRLALLLALLLQASSLQASSLNAAESLNVAVASNFVSTAKKIALEFEVATGATVNFSSASTGLLYAQIVNGAPFDVFLAADQETPLRLRRDGLVLQDQVFDYASGELVLWSNSPRFAHDNCQTELITGEFRKLAIANPRTAPYGAAAKRYLQSMKLWNAVQSNIVYGENVAQTYQFVASGNATLGLLAKSQVLSGDTTSTTCLVAIDAAHVEQSGAILKASHKPALAQAFVKFLSSPSVIRVLQQSGYSVNGIATPDEH